ncbi:NUDIX domain-containing protein [Streptomyces sp. RM99]|uniref:NUDIX domain-containing protein n=1 Tax=Streptomyces sp. RM99 TaxID=2824897 RepID=UPI001FFD78D9|nr:NUDIX domain-containing protein [Streptomyces sp. RM99]
MTSAVTQDPPPQPPEGTAPDGEQQDAGVRAEEYLYRDESRLRAGSLLTSRTMARRLPSLVRRSVRMAWRVDRGATVGLLMCQIGTGVLAALGLLAVTGTITALVSSGEITERLWDAAPQLAVIAAAAGLRALMGIAVVWLTGRLRPVLGRAAELTMIEAALGAELAANNKPGYNDAYDIADRGAQVTPDLVEEAQDVLAATATLAAGATVLTVLHPLLLPLLFLACLPQAAAYVRSARVLYLAGLETSGRRRMLNKLRWHMAYQESSEEMRACLAGPFLTGRYRRLAASVNAAERKAANTGAWMGLAGAVAGGVASAAVWAALLWLLASGRMSLAAGGGAVFALQTATGSVRGIINGGARLVRTGWYVQDWQNFLDNAHGQAMIDSRGTASLPAAPERFEVRDVTYRYDGAPKDSLSNVSLHVKRGEIVALVGENGSGKTTLSRLLCGLLLPTEGDVAWDHASTADLDPWRAWEHVALVPQKFTYLPLTMRDNLTFGQGDTSDAALLAACEASGAAEMLPKLRSGLNTLLTSEWFGGQQLSGGQWQRLVLTRAFHRRAALLVMDEPTAALDARAEHRIFAGLRELAKDRAVLLITHRLTNVAVADRIVVLDQGRIVQEGTYAQLTRQPGLFRSLWELQRRMSGDALQVEPEAANASALIYNDRGEYLLHLRDYFPGQIWEPGMWSLLGGGREPQDATLEDTVRRELAEEAGLDLADLSPFATEYASHDDGTTVPIAVYAGRWNGDPRELRLTEGVMLAWFTPDDLHRLRIADTTSALVRRHAAGLPPMRSGPEPEPEFEPEPTPAPAPAPAEHRPAPPHGTVPHIIGVHLYLERPDGTVLLGLRHPDSAFAPSTWHVLAGHCEQENAIDCLIREAREEAGLRIERRDVELVHVVHHIGQPRNPPRMGLFFRARTWGGEPVLCEPDKCTQWKFWDPAALPDDLVPYTRLAITKIRNGEPYSETGWPA